MAKTTSRGNVHRRRTAFTTFVTVLVAAVTVVGAAVAWRISVASGKAETSDAAGLAAALNSTNTTISTATYLSNNLNFFVRYRQHLAAADLLDKQVAATIDPARRSFLREAALQERNLAATERSYVDADYLELDPSDGSESFNGNRYWEAQLASERATQALDERPFFASAYGLRIRARSLTVVTIVLSAVVFLLVAATVVRRRVRYYLAGFAVLVFAASCAAAILVEIAKRG